MKTTLLLLLATVLITAGCQSAATAPVATPSVTKGNLTVNFPDSDKYMDCREDFGGSTSQHYLDIITEHLQRVVSPRLADGQKLSVTFTDIDLAGDFLPGRAQMQHVRVIKEIYRPRMVVKFVLTGADGKTIKEGDRTLTDLNFMTNIGISGRSDPLYYDKELLTQWAQDEFKK
jgi:hypothetical protein